MLGTMQDHSLTYQSGVITLPDGSTVNMAAVEKLIAETYRETTDPRLKQIAAHLAGLFKLNAQPHEQAAYDQFQLKALKDLGYSIVQTDASTVNRCGYYVHPESGNVWVWLTKSRACPIAYRSEDAAIEAARNDSYLESDDDPQGKLQPMRWEKFAKELLRRHSSKIVDVVGVLARTYVRRHDESDLAFLTRAAMLDYKMYPGSDCTFIDLIECGIKLREVLTAEGKL